MRLIALAPAVAGVLMVAAGTASAATKSTTMSVSATVAANCNVSAENLAFGDYDATATLTSDADITVRCSTGTPYTVKLSAGGGSFAQRLLASGSDTLQYNLFTTANLQNIWGDGSGSTGTMGGSGLGLSANKAITHVVYGQLPNSAFNQDAPTGSYTDTITVTVEY
jgi:spore coat protein U-like protein